MQFDAVAVKAQLRLTSQRLEQAQAKNESHANIARTDIATLIQRGTLSVARDKAEKMILDEAFGNLLQEVEIHIGILQECFHELESNGTLSHATIEAASTIIYAAPYLHSIDLDGIRKFLIQRLGLAAVGNRASHVSPRVVKAVSTAIPSAFQLDAYMQDIADRCSISWTPGPTPQNMINILSEFLDPNTNSEVDLSRLRDLCLRGIPDDPVWLRPRIWKLFFGLLPNKKALWKAESTKQRDDPQDLVKRLLEPSSHLGLDHIPLDDTLLAAYKQLSSLPAEIYFLLQDELDISVKSPLHDDAPEDVKIIFAQYLEDRLKFLQNRTTDTSHRSRTPEIRLDPAYNTTPGILLTSFDSVLSENSNLQTTLLPSRKCVFGGAHPTHCSSLLRLLYLHHTINPGSPSYHTASVLVPLYSALTQEVDPDDTAHVEADTFWLLEAVLAEFSGLEDDDGRVWMKMLSERLRWADLDFFTDLEGRGLDPSFPHYSYRWLMPMLTHTLPLGSLFPAWDALFSRLPREKGLYPKPDYLLDICASMLLRAKSHLFRLHNVPSNTHSLWTTDIDNRTQSSWTQVQGQSRDPFMEALSFLQSYNPKYVGGIERVLQTASELAQRHDQESSSELSTIGLGARFKINMWKGFMPQSLPSKVLWRNIRNGRNYVDSDETETEASQFAPNSNLASLVTGTLWRANQATMEENITFAPPSPEPPVKVIESKAVGTRNGYVSSSQSQGSTLWSYTEKLKDSDTVATFSKVGSNWRARGLLGSWGIDSFHTLPGLRGIEKDCPPQVHPHSNERRGSVPLVDSPQLFSPPAMSPEKPIQNLSEPQPSNANLIGRFGQTKSLISMTRSPPPTTPKSAPRPLLLKNSTFVTSGQRHSRSAGADTMSTPDTDEWADVMRTKRQHFHRDSQSSVSSLSPSDAFMRNMKSSKSDKESEAGASRIIAINRRSVSPMAPNFRVGHMRPSSGTSTSSGFNSPPMVEKSPRQENSLIGKQTISLLSDDRQRPSIIAALPITASSLAESESSDTTSNELLAAVHNSPRKGIEPDYTDDIANSVSIGIPARATRVRSKRYSRPANLHIQDDQQPRISVEQKTLSSYNLTVEWPVLDQENILTPKASNFDSDDSPEPPRSPRYLRKYSSGNPERLRKTSVDRSSEERSRKISTGYRARKVSSENREVPRSRRESAAEEGDDEGYDDLLSAYESEGGTRVLYRDPR